MHDAAQPVDVTGRQAESLTLPQAKPAAAIRISQLATPGLR